jgi:hypothetical protein
MPKQKIRSATINLDTGEITDGIFVYCPRKQHSLFSKGGFMVLSQERSDMLANSDLGLVDFKVLHKLIAILDMDNLIAINQSEIAVSMGLQKQHFNRAVKKLVSEKILIEGAKLGQHKSYRLNAYYGWKGSTENHNVALESDPVPLSDRMKQSRIESVIEGGKKSN